MMRYIAYRVAQAVPTLLLASVGVWAIIYALPGDPVSVVLGNNASDEAIQAYRTRMGLDQPIALQFTTWLSNALRGDLGTSYTTGFPVVELIGNRLYPTVQLSIVAFLIGGVLALAFATIVAVRPRSVLARLVRTQSVLALSVPSFWVGILFILVFSVQLGLLPSVSDYVALWESPGRALLNLVMPGLTLGIFISALLGRFLLESMESVLQKDHVRTARAKGQTEFAVVTRHVLRNALLPFVTVAGLLFGTFFGGAVITESVFNYPGLGRLIVGAIEQRDYVLIQGTVLCVLVVVILINIVVDVLYAYLDPRIRY